MQDDYGTNTSIPADTIISRDMSDRHYLLKVLGISAIPRLITFALKLISFPLMVRNLGATEFGVVVYIGAVIAVLESFVDFGVSSAAGKEIAVARETSSVSLSAVIKKWARLQTIVAVIGLGPLLLVSYFAASAGSDIKFNSQVLVILVLGSWITISLNFVRASLTSVLAFKSLGALDAFESVLRSAGWLVVAYYVPTTYGFAVVTLITVAGASALGVVILWQVVSRSEGPHPISGDEAVPNPALNLRYMVKESLTFLWLRLVTRVFQSIPILVFGRLFGSEVVGVVGAFARIVELINFPFGVIGNALAVRAPGVLAKGTGAAKVLWDAVSRFMAVSLMLSVTFYLGAELMARLLLPDSKIAGRLLAILSITVLANAVSSVIAPMSDYVGALRSRNVLLTTFAFVQVPVIWFGARTFGELGAVSAYVLVLALMNCGYIKIALGVFFPQAHYRLRSEVSYFVMIAVAALLLTLLLHWILPLDRLWSLASFNALTLYIAVFWSTVLAGLLFHQPAKKFFLTRIFFDFQIRNNPTVAS